MNIFEQYKVFTCALTKNYRKYIYIFIQKFLSVIKNCCQVLFVDTKAFRFKKLSIGKRFLHVVNISHKPYFNNWFFYSYRCKI